MIDKERRIRIALADIEWELEIDNDPRIVAELEEERESLTTALLLLMAS